MSGETWSVGRLARRHGLSRSTLLYYDRLGLLRPSGRTAAGYRTYGAADDRRLARICRFRAAGLPLADIADLLDASEADAEHAGAAGVLERHLHTLNGEIARLREQQRVVLSLLDPDTELADARALDVDRWVAILRAAGLDGDARRRWHVEFERLSPEAHQDFLESLGIEPDGITHIRAWSRGARDA